MTSRERTASNESTSSLSRERTLSKERGLTKLKRKTSQGGQASGRIKEIVGGSAIAFANADSNGNLELTFEEFKNVIPANMSGGLSNDILRELFEMADTNQDGVVSVSYTTSDAADEYITV